MKLSGKEILHRLGAGESISQLCAAAGISREQFDAFWQAEIRRRVPDPNGERRVAVRRSVQIARDRWGIPHIFADNDQDLYFGFGYAMAQDRLFQLDYLRRRGSGRLAEILGADGSELDLLTRVPGFRNVFELDLLARTVGLRRIAEKEWQTLSSEVRALVEAFSRGVNAHMEECHDSLPIEFDLLDYQPELWSPVDCLTIEGEFRWYLTGRFPVIVIPELLKRKLGDGPLYRAFFDVEEDEESIIPAGSYPPNRHGVQPMGGGDAFMPSGSNNWVVAGSRSVTGKPLLASDPHIAFDAVSCWYEVHLCGGSFNVAGAAYTGIPGLIFGSNERVAWGVTNNICSQRDLYQEKSDPAHPGCFLYDGNWEPATEREEIIHVKGTAPVRKIIRSSRNGTIVNEVLPPLARQTGPVSLKWLGAYHGGWLTALLGMNRARSTVEFRAALQPWHVPTFSLVFADVDGHIGYQSTGRIPIRNVWERGYRPGWDPAHQWQDLIPFDGMPRLIDPERGWIATANNRPAPDDFPYPLAGCWNEGMRARRIRELIEAKPKLSRSDFAAMHQDALSLRARKCTPHLAKVLAASKDPRILEGSKRLQTWDFHVTPESVAATIFEAFWAQWTKVILRERFEESAVGFLSGSANGIASLLLAEDKIGWFAKDRRQKAILRAMTAGLDWLTEKLGPDMDQWTWGRLHTLTIRHILSGRGDLGALLNHGGVPVRGNMHTVCNTGLGGAFESRSGATYRLIADLSASPPVLWAVDSQSQSGHPGSLHYGDQFRTWLQGEYHQPSLDRGEASRIAVSNLKLTPKTVT